MSKLKLLFATTVALVAFGAIAGSAGAFEAEVDPAGAVNAIGSGKTSFGESPQIRCNLTLRQTLKATTGIDAGDEIGRVTEVNIRACEGGSVSGVLGLPWELRVESLSGSGPDNLTGANLEIVDSAFNLSVFGGFVNCLYEGHSGAILNTTDTGTNRYSASTVRANENVFVDFVRGSGLCPEQGNFAGNFTLSPTQTLVVS